MTTIFTHPAVEKYLADMDAALRDHPSNHADDLRAQVREHIEESLDAHPSDADVEATLARLGPAALLAADEIDARPKTADARPSVTGWLKQRPRSFWATVVAVVVLLSAATVAVTVETNVAPIQANCYPCAFLFPEDSLHSTEPPTYEGDRMIVRQRFGQDQAISFSLSNPSRYAQVVKGGLIGPPAPYALEPMSLEISTVGPGHEGFRSDWPQKFTRGDVVIPPHGIRQVVLHLVENSCTEPGGAESFDSLQIHVRALGLDRTETVQIGLAFTIVGSSAKGHCRNGQTAHGTFRTSQ